MWLYTVVLDVIRSGEGGDIRDGVNVFYMGRVRVWEWYECVLLGEIGDYDVGIWEEGRDFGVCAVGLLWDLWVWFCCVCWDEVDNALRKGRGFPKNVNRGYVYKYIKS